MLVACGRIESGSTDSTADGADATANHQTGGVDSVGGSGSDQSGTGGDRASGGRHATGGAEPATSTGGMASNLPEPWGPCNYEHPGLEPPCDESDVNGVVSGCGLWFDVPLAHVVPPALGLQVVLLPLEPSDGVSGVGGTGAPTEPLALELFLVLPEHIPWEAGETSFDLLEPAGFVRAGNTNEGELRRYVTEVNGYGVARVALRQGAETLSVYRGLYLGEVASIATSDVCIK